MKDGYDLRVSQCLSASKVARIDSYSLYVTILADECKIPLTQNGNKYNLTNEVVLSDLR